MRKEEEIRDKYQQIQKIKKSGFHDKVKCRTALDTLNWVLGNVNQKEKE